MHFAKISYNHNIMEKFTIHCPCCEAILSIDAQTGAILTHEEKGKKLSSFEELQQDLHKQKENRDNIFAQEMSSQKDRKRILEEKFNEAMKRAESEVCTYRHQSARCPGWVGAISGMTTRLLR